MNPDRNMKIAVICFTKHGEVLSQKIQEELKKNVFNVFNVDVYTMKKANSDCENKSPVFNIVNESLGCWTKTAFDSYKGIVFVGAVGIAVRAIAPYIKSKNVDPAVVVIDDKSHFVISILSGHLGGANRLTEIIANSIGAVPVITTATDINKKFAVDSWAAAHHFSIENMEKIKNISAAVLDEKEVYIYSEFPFENDFSKELVAVERYKFEEMSKEGKPCIFISDKNRIYEKNGSVDEKDFSYLNMENVLRLIPKSICVGIGCRKGIEKDVVKNFLEEILEKNNINKRALHTIASINLKWDETSLIELSCEYGIPFITYSAEELKEVPGKFTESEFVWRITGVSNICERAAVLSSEGGKLITRREVKDGVTIALARIEEWL